MADEWRDFHRRHNTYAWLNSNPSNLVGNTSAENLYVAIMLSQLAGFKGKNILVLFYDKADQYSGFPPPLPQYSYPVPKPRAEEIPSYMELVWGLPQKAA